ncbi:MAG: flagellar protein FlaG [Acidobacteria bacterium]|nr:flagellar protein FlaG [Acidobacteriota bacterium]
MDIPNVNRIMDLGESKRPFDGESNPRATPQKMISNGDAPSTVISKPDIESVASRDLSQIEKSVVALNEKLLGRNQQARIEIDRKSHQIVFRLVDLESGETLRQVPPEEMLRMAEQMAVDSETHLIETTI